MMKYFLLVLTAITLFGRGYEAPENRTQAIKLIKKIHFDYKKTWLNSCDYTYDLQSCMDKTMVDTSTCSVQEQNQTVKWIQVVPDSFYGRNRECMNEEVCVSKYTGKNYKGKRCCRQSDAAYRKMEADLFNFIPVVSSIADKRKDQIFMKVDKAEYVVGKVKMDAKAIEPPDNLKGDIARVYLYMNERYGLDLTLEEKEDYYYWHKLDSVDKRECAIAKTIMKIQGSTNRWIKEGCR
ncbi:endonuclease [Sulfurimonas sp. HSL3-7]|uniref:endonuclease n=1 Tax=Sulfonitrofixus jiaomeiensis TaxID=3131938 RepID=UPI0031F9BD1E